MYIKEITKDFLIKGMLETALDDEPEINMAKEVENELLNLIDEIEEEEDRDEDREEELQEYKNALAEVRKYPEDNDAAYKTYSFYYGKDDIIDDLYDRYNKQAELKGRIEILAGQYVKILREMPDDMQVEVDFSYKSQSVYIKTEVAATEENVEEFAYLGDLCIVSRNIYDENESYGTDKNIEIRLSDHDFGGYHRSYGIGEYFSYEKDCISYVYLC